MFCRREIQTWQEQRYGSTRSSDVGQEHSLQMVQAVTELVLCAVFPGVMFVDSMCCKVGVVLARTVTAASVLRANPLPGQHMVGRRMTGNQAQE